jgi:hypothetical protein
LEDIDGDRHVQSPLVEINQDQFNRMIAYGEYAVTNNGGFTDYAVLSNSCITFVRDILQFGNVTTPLSSLFTAADRATVGDVWIWYHSALDGVPNPGWPIRMFANEMGFVPDGEIPVIAVPKAAAEQVLGHAITGNKEGPTAGRRCSGRR